MCFYNYWPKELNPFISEEVSVFFQVHLFVKKDFPIYIYTPFNLASAASFQVLNCFTWRPVMGGFHLKQWELDS